MTQRPFFISASSFELRSFTTALKGASSIGRGASARASSLGLSWEDESGVPMDVPTGGAQCELRYSRSLPVISPRRTRLRQATKSTSDWRQTLVSSTKIIDASHHDVAYGQGVRSASRIALTHAQVRCIQRLARLAKGRGPGRQSRG